MPILFSHLCRLLTDLQRISHHDPPHLPVQRRQLERDSVASWFRSRNLSIQTSSEDLSALLSTVLPTKRTDRVYNIQHQRLIGILKRCLGLGLERARMLEQWTVPGKGDLADCVERIVRQTEDPPTLARLKVTVNEIDAALAGIASRCRFSSSKVRDREADASVLKTLEGIFQRLHSEEAKWLTRLILKDFSCLDIDSNLVYAAIDPSLPIAVHMYDDFETAIIELKRALALQRQGSATGDGRTSSRIGITSLSPQLGIKVGAPRWIKAKGGIKHVATSSNGELMSVERKYDGEYCQIHVDMSKGEECIQIFSKSGKDSTHDRMSMHPSILQGLRIGKADCHFRNRVILEGELLVFSDREKRILPFHKIRKHICRSGTYLGTDKDSQPHPWEHLMLVFYDVLLCDDDVLLHKPYEQRRKLLKRLVERVEGRSDFVWRRTADMSSIEGVNCLKKCLAHAFASRWEGLVLKPCHSSYFGNGEPADGLPPQWIKLKKDCIKGLGDTADFLVVGAGYDAKTAVSLGIPNLQWTHFFIGCLTNKEAVRHNFAKPEVIVLDCVHDCMKGADVKTLNQQGKFRAMDSTSEEARAVFDLRMGAIGQSTIKMTTVFREPYIFDVAGSGFDVPSNEDVFVLRFPRVIKVHWDRDWKETISLEELQDMAHEALKLPEEDLRTEVTSWMERLEKMEPSASIAKIPWIHTDEEDSIALSHRARLDSRGDHVSRNKRTKFSAVEVYEDRNTPEPSESGPSVSCCVLTSTSIQQTRPPPPTSPTPESVRIETSGSVHQVETLSSVRIPHKYQSPDGRPNKYIKSTIGSSVQKSPIILGPPAAALQSSSATSSPLREIQNSAFSRPRPSNHWRGSIIAADRPKIKSDLKIPPTADREYSESGRPYKKIKMPTSRIEDSRSTEAMDQDDAAICRGQDVCTGTVETLDRLAEPVLVPEQDLLKEYLSQSLEDKVPDFRKTFFFLSPHFSQGKRSKHLDYLLTFTKLPPVQLPNISSSEIFKATEPHIEIGSDRLIFLDTTIADPKIGLRYMEAMVAKLAGLQMTEAIAQGTRMEIWNWKILEDSLRFAVHGNCPDADGRTMEDMVDDQFGGIMEVLPPGHVDGGADEWYYRFLCRGVAPYKRRLDKVTGPLPPA